MRSHMMRPSSRLSFGKRPAFTVRRISSCLRRHSGPPLPETGRAAGRRTSLPGSSLPSVRLKGGAAVPCAISLTPLILTTSCANHRLAERLSSAVIKQGPARAEIVRPQCPAECTSKAGHAPLIAGREALTALNQERAALELQWTYQDLCTAADDLYWRELAK